MATDVWAEPLANLPLIYYEGTPHPIGELESIVDTDQNASSGWGHCG
jgi:hypothetical protein